MKKMYLIILIILLTNCQTPYQKKTFFAFRGGYTDTKLSNNSFSIVSNGNGWTSSYTIKKYALRRSAEVALENGFNYFVISQQSNDQIRKTVHGAGLTGIVVGNAVPKPLTNYIIFCYKNRPKTSEEVYEAKAVIKEY